MLVIIDVTHRPTVDWKDLEDTHLEKNAINSRWTRTNTVLNMVLQMCYTQLFVERVPILHIVLLLFLLLLPCFGFCFPDHSKARIHIHMQRGRERECIGHLALYKFARTSYVFQRMFDIIVTSAELPAKIEMNAFQ